MVKECKIADVAALFYILISMGLSKDTLLKDLTVGQFEAVLKALNFSGAKSQEVYLNTIEAAEFIRKSPQALRQIVYNGKIKSLKRGNNLLFLKSDLIEWLEKGRKLDKASSTTHLPFSFLNRK